MKLLYESSGAKVPGSSIHYAWAKKLSRLLPAQAVVGISTSMKVCVRRAATGFALDARSAYRRMNPSVLAADRKKRNL